VSGKGRGEPNARTWAVEAMTSTTKKDGSRRWKTEARVTTGSTTEKTEGFIHGTKIRTRRDEADRCLKKIPDFSRPTTLFSALVFIFLLLRGPIPPFAVYAANATGGDQIIGTPGLWPKKTPA
jgi:hypothetical protein